MDLGVAFDRVLEIAQTCNHAEDGWARLISYLASVVSEVPEAVRRVDIRADVDSLKRQLLALASEEPPSTSVNAVYFGLFDDADGIGFYVVGLDTFDPDDPGRDPTWAAEDRYLSSAALDAVREAELESDDEAAASLLGYAGQLGAALILVKYATQDTFGGLDRVVGFDSGDFAVLPRD